jgi:hypothetical protein
MEVIAWETEPGFAVHMLDYNCLNAFRGRLREPVALGTQTVRIQLRGEVKIKTASLRRAETKVDFKLTRLIVELIVPSVKIYEVLALEI